MIQPELGTKENLDFEFQEQNHKLAITVAVISWSMLFATLLLGYFVYRYTQTVWPPLGVEKISLFLPNISLAFVILSSVSFFLGIGALKTQHFVKMRRYHWLTFLLGGFYMLTQVGFWKSLNSMNILSSSNIFGSILHGFTWIHAGHMVCALSALLVGIFVTRKDSLVLKWRIYMQNVAVFWHFLTIVWLVLYFTLFIF